MLGSIGMCLYACISNWQEFYLVLVPCNHVADITNGS